MMVHSESHTSHVRGGTLPPVFAMGVPIYMYCTQVFAMGAPPWTSYSTLTCIVQGELGAAIAAVVLEVASLIW